jgi:eukaryotic-like serine/threonine-protein kinase
VVYRGEDERLNRPVCIKVFHKLRTDIAVWRTSYEHFVQEAFALSRLTHPNTLRIYDFGHLTGEADGDGDADAGRPFQVSEFMNGGTLWHLVKADGPLPAAEAARVVGALCGALAEAHDCGIVHRDIKPKNILFGTAGRSRLPKLADFGIAKSLPLDRERLHNQAGDTEIVAGHRLIMYSPCWAAPEQLIGTTVTPATDIYSLALITIFMLTGRLVFSARDLEASYDDRAEGERLIAAALEDAGLPARATKVFQEACAFDPRDRLSSVDDFGRALDEALSEAEPVTVPFERSEPELTSVSTPAAGQPGAGSAPPRRLRPATEPVLFGGGRRSRFVPLTSGAAEVDTAGVRLRVTVLPAAGGPSVHVKGLTCFVGADGRPPSAAVNLAASGALALVTPNRIRIADARLCLGSPAAGHTLLAIGEETVAIGSDECPFVFALDFGPGSECLFLYTPGVAPPDARQRPRRRRTAS